MPRAVALQHTPTCPERSNIASSTNFATTGSGDVPSAFELVGACLLGCMCVVTLSRFVSLSGGGYGKVPTQLCAPPHFGPKRDRRHVPRNAQVMLHHGLYAWKHVGIHRILRIAVPFAMGLWVWVSQCRHWVVGGGPCGKNNDSLSQRGVEPMQTRMHTHTQTHSRRDTHQERLLKLPQHPMTNPTAHMDMSSPVVCARSIPMMEHAVDGSRARNCKPNCRAMWRACGRIANVASPFLVSLLRTPSAGQG